MATCSSCGAPIFWCVTDQGKRMPVDAKPSGDGNVLMFECPETGKDMCEVIGDLLKRELAVEQGELLYKSHFARARTRRSTASRGELCESCTR